MLKKLLMLWLQWRTEAIGILLAVALFLGTPRILRLFDPTAAAYDPGVLHQLIFAVVAVLGFSFCSWVGMKINAASIFKWGQSEKADKDFNELTPWQKTKTYWLIYFAYLFAFVLSARVL